jgi:hypothetical protein
MIIAQRVRKFRVVGNPQKGKTARSGAKRRSKNQAARTFSVALFKSKQRSQRMKSSRKKKNKTAKARNPMFFARKAKDHKKRRNPSLPAVVSKPVDMMKAGALAAAGLIATRQVPQMLLGSRNQGILGYGANFVVAGVTAAVAGKAMGRASGTAVLIGGALYIVNRMLSDFTPLGQRLALSGVGDAAAAGHLGAIVPGYFFRPQLVDNRGNRIDLSSYVQKQAAAIAAPAAAPVNRLSGMRRFAR